MISEYFDIVDENNAPLGITKERSLAHQSGDWHRSVHVYVLNDKNEFLVHLRSPYKDLHPNCWDTRFGGHVLAGSTVGETAVKELGEEVGLKVKINDLIKGPVVKNDGGMNKEFNNIYYYKFRSGDIIKFNDEEVIEVKWMSIQEVLQSVKNNSSQWSAGASILEKIYNYWKEINKN